VNIITLTSNGILCLDIVIGKYLARLTASDSKLRLTWAKALPTNISCNNFEQLIFKPLSTTEFKSYMIFEKLL